MYEDDAGLVLSPMDLTKHLACGHLTTLDLQVLRGELGPPAQEDEVLELIFRLGLEHEKAYLARLWDLGFTVVEIPQNAGLNARVQLTDDALGTGADVVYQATFLDHGHRGSADFLLRVERRSLLGAHSYDVADTKLARKMKVAALLQMADCGRHLQRLQGRPPEWLTVVTGDGQERRFRYADAAAYAGRAIRQLRAAIEHPVPTRPEPVSHCGQCRWSARCQAQWRREDHLSLVAFMRGDHRHALEQAGAGTVAQLAASDPEQLPLTIASPSRVRLQAQAAWQVLERKRRPRTMSSSPRLPAPACSGCPHPARGTSTWTSKATPTPRVVRAASNWPACGTERAHPGRRTAAFPAAHRPRGPGRWVAARPALARPDRPRPSAPAPG